MDVQRALGLWKSSFGPVKIEAATDRAEGEIRGVWVYDRDGQEVIGYFGGRLQGNVLNFEWHEPANPGPLDGAGYLVFDPDGRAFSGKWWTNSRERSGAWNGWRSSDAGQGEATDGPAVNDGVPADGVGPAEPAGAPPPDYL